MTDQLFANRYRIIRQLGRGSFGVVHLAQDTRLADRLVALKVIHPQLALDPDSLHLFEKEAGILAKLRHDHIVTVYDADIWREQRYLVMEYIQGPSLAQVAAEGGAQPPERAAAWLRQAAQALAYAHQMKVIHRDVKSANLLWEEKRDRIYMSDFGLARAVEMSGGSSSGRSLDVLTGTAAYRAPEVRKTGHTVSSDLYSLGVVAYELLAGKRPFEGNDPLDLMIAHAQDPVPPLPAEIPDWLREVVLRLLEKTPEERYKDAFALLEALTEQPKPSSPPRIVDSTPAAAPPRSSATPIRFDWVTIPAGKFIMGSDKKRDTNAYSDETPQHEVYVPEFQIARVPVTNAQYKAFVDATGYVTTAEEKGTALGYVNGKWEWVKGADWRHPRGPKSSIQGKDHHPVTCISWHDAMAFCKWAGVRLPTEAEWEKAARGTDGRIWPWGNEQPTKEHCNFNRNVDDTTPVGKYPKGASPYGCLDMAGNVWEWTSSRWGGTDWAKPGYPYPYDPDDGREDLTVDDSRVLRGGSFSDNAASVRCAYRDGCDPDGRDGDRGFRVVLPPGF